MSMEKPPFCKFVYCPAGEECTAAEKCLSIDGLPGKIEHPDGKTSPPQETPLMDSLLRSIALADRGVNRTSGTPRADHYRKEFRQRKETSELISWLLDEFEQTERRLAEMTDERDALLLRREKGQF